jgi:hypothetical protein
MKALVALLILAAIGAGVYYFFIADSAAYVSFQKFSTAVARGDREEALRYAKTPEVLGGEDQNRGQNTGGMPVDALMGIRYSRESEKKNPDGTVTIVALQSVHFDPPGTTSAMGAMISKYRQTATLEKSSGKWVVTSLDSEFVETRNWKGEKQ